MLSIEIKNPYKKDDRYFYECSECKEHREISKNTWYAMNKKANPILCCNCNRRKSAKPQEQFLKDLELIS